MANERALKLKIRELETKLSLRVTQLDLLARMTNEALRLLPAETQKALGARWQKGAGEAPAAVKVEVQRELGRLASLTVGRELLVRAAHILSILPLGSSPHADELIAEIDGHTGRPTPRVTDAAVAQAHAEKKCEPASCPICKAFPSARRRREQELGAKPRVVEALREGEATGAPLEPLASTPEGATEIAVAAMARDADPFSPDVASELARKRSTGNMLAGLQRREPGPRLLEKDLPGLTPRAVVDCPSPSGCIRHDRLCSSKAECDETCGRAPATIAELEEQITRNPTEPRDHLPPVEKPRSVDEQLAHDRRAVICSANACQTASRCLASSAEECPKADVLWRRPVDADSAVLEEQLAKVEREQLDPEAAP